MVSESLNESISRNVCRLLDLRGMSQADLAVGAGLTTASVSQIVNMKVLPKSDTLYRLAEGLGVTPDVLLGCTKYTNADLLHKNKRLKRALVGMQKALSQVSDLLDPSVVL